MIIGEKGVKMDPQKWKPLFMADAEAHEDVQAFLGLANFTINRCFIQDVSKIATTLK